MKKTLIITIAISFYFCSCRKTDDTTIAEPRIDNSTLIEKTIQREVSFFDYRISEMDTNKLIQSHNLKVPYPSIDSLIIGVKRITLDDDINHYFEKNDSLYCFEVYRVATTFSVHTVDIYYTDKHGNKYIDALEIYK